MRNTWGVVVVAALVAGCTEPTLESGAGSRSPSVSAGFAAQPPARPATLDDQFAQLAEEVPGFGGLYMEDGELRAYLADPRVVDAPAANANVRAAVARFLDVNDARGRGRELAAAMRFSRGEFEFRQLRGFHQRLFARAGDASITLLDIDERRNRVVVGVENEGAAEGVRAFAASLGIPARALIVEVRPPVSTLALLSDQIRPVPGGVKIEYAAGAWCTLGVNARDKLWDATFTSTNYFVTNSHCSNSFASTDGVSYGQPTLSNGIGTEVYDPPLQYGYPNCPDYEYCRFSDATLAVYNVSATSIHWPYIAQTTSGTTYAGVTANVFFQSGRTPYAGETVTKVGARTGTTAGMVTETCSSVKHPDGPWMICQSRANLTADKGDSGAPVYQEISNSRYWNGLLWGGGAGYIYFSNFVWIAYELDETPLINHLCAAVSC